MRPRQSRLTRNNPVGRPSIYTAELAAAICTRLAEGESLRTICLASDMPHRESVRRWLRDDEAFRGHYARAREDQAHSVAEVAVDDAVASRDPRLAFDARRWYAGKLAPKVYGDKLQHTDANGTGPVGMVMNILTGVPRHEPDNRD